MDISELVNLSSKAWCFPILASLHRGVPGRQAALVHATGAGRTAFVHSLEHLLKAGAVERNPGHGHPLRPEFRLTPKGVGVAAIADGVEALAALTEQRQLVRRAWTLPVLAATAEPMRFKDLKQGLPGITDRALSLSLQRLEAMHWMDRTVQSAARPPRPTYVARAQGREISRLLAV